jgi:hypothetical protein
MDETEASKTDATVASPQAADAPTDLHEPVEVEPTLAYSDEPDHDDSRRRRGWFVVPVFVVAVVAFAFAVAAECWLWIGAHHTRAAPVPTRPALPPVTAEPPPSVPWPPEPVSDRRFVEYVTGHGVVLGNDFQAEITNAHNMCAYLGSGHSHELAVAKLMTYSPYSADGASVFVDGAIRAYYPQFAAPAP